MEKVKKSYFLLQISVFVLIQNYLKAFCVDSFVL